MKRGLFISIDGPDGTGKTTQTALLAEHLQAIKRKVVKTREPGTTDIHVCRAIRNILLNPAYKDQIPPAADLCLFSADRAIHTSYFIKPKLEEGYDVISDRFVDSTTVYQGIGSGLPLETVLLLNQVVTQGLYPDITFFLDANNEQTNSKITTKEFGTHDRIESRSHLYHIKIIEGFRGLAKLSPERIKLIPYRKDEPNTVHLDIRSYIDKLIEQHQQ